MTTKVTITVSSESKNSAIVKTQVNPVNNKSLQYTARFTRIAENESREFLIGQNYCLIVSELDFDDTILDWLDI